MSKFSEVAGSSASDSTLVAQSVWHSLHLGGALPPSAAQQAQALLAQGLALHQQGQVAQAQALYSAALQLAPDLIDAQHLLGVTLGQTGAAAQGEEWVRKAVQARPDFGPYRNSLGRLLLLQGKMDQAVEQLREALRLSPQNAEGHFNLAEAEFAAGRLEDAAAHYEQALKLQPTHAAARFGLAQAVRLRQGWAAALPHYQLAAAMAPDAPMGQYHLALALHMGGHVPQALEIYQRINARWPEFADAWVGAGSVLFGLNRLRESIAAYEKALALQPDHGNALDGLVEARRKACDWRDDMAALEQRLRERTLRDLAEGRQASARIFTALYTAFSAEEILAIGRSNALAARPADTTPRWTDAARGDGRLRVGYLLADARDHPNAHNMLSVFGLHDRTRVEVFTYSWGPDDGSRYRQRIVADSEHFVELRGASDEEMAQRIARDGIQVLVDLMGHTADNRLGVLWRKPAPVQMLYLGFPGSSGAACMDYVLVDRWVVPPGREGEVSEAPIRLPYCYFPLADHVEVSIPATPTRQQLGLPEGVFVYCCFNNPNKISAEDFARWMRLMRSVPDAVLWLYQPNELVAGNLRSAARRAGVDPARLLFAPHLPRPQHLARLRLADLFLDTSPYGAHTTTGDALRAGVPVLTVFGQTFASRVAASMLAAANLPECILPDWPAWEARAIELARTGTQTLKAKLAEPLALPLFDIQRQVRDLERAYFAAWERFCRGEPVQGFDLAAEVSAEEAR